METPKRVGTPVRPRVLQIVLVQILEEARLLIGAVPPGLVFVDHDAIEI